MRRTIIGASVDMVRKLAATVAADQPAAQQATTAANTATQAAQAAQQAAATASQQAQQALSNNATLTQTVDALNKLSTDYVTAVKASQDDRADLRRLITALQARKVVIARGQVTTPVLALGASADIPVALSRAPGTTDYDVEAIVAPALLGKVTVTVKSKTAAGLVTVTLKATIAITASSIDVTAYQLTPLTP